MTTAYKFCQRDDVLCVTPQIGSDYDGFDDLITQIIPAATRSIQKYARRTFLTAQYTEYFASQDNLYTALPQTLWLKEWPIDIGQTFEIKVNYAYDWANEAVLESQFYQLDTENSKVTLINVGLEFHPRSIQVVYTAGFVADATDTEFIVVDEDIKLATSMQASWLLQRIADTQLGQREEEGRPIPKRLTWEAVHGLIPSAASIMKKYRRQLVGTVY